MTKNKELHYKYQLTLKRCPAPTTPSLYKETSLIKNRTRIRQTLLIATYTELFETYLASKSPLLPKTGEMIRYLNILKSAPRAYFKNIHRKHQTVSLKTLKFKESFILAGEIKKEQTPGMAHKRFLLI